jgi:hypothetical protein
LNFFGCGGFMFKQCEVNTSKSMGLIHN